MLADVLQAEYKRQADTALLLVSSEFEGRYHSSSRPHLRDLLQDCAHNLSAVCKS